jgi:rSAM/selenodomain-associated transferase 2
VSVSLSVVIPTLNEAAELPATVAYVRAVPEVAEIIVADGGSRDGTLPLAADLNCIVVSSPMGRGTQLRAGAQRARGDVVVLLHADTWVRPDWGRAIGEALSRRDAVGGGCYKRFRDPSWLMRGSRLRCAVRFHFFQRFMGDQAMFVRRDVLERVGGVPDVPIMEEFELGRLLRREGRLALANTVVSTSARRFRERGVLRTYLRMGYVTLRYQLGTPLDELRRLYERR